MKVVARIDVGRMDAPAKTPQGFLRVPAHVARAGVQVYYNADGTERREYRPTSEVFHADSLSSLLAAPVTHLHPSEMVTPENRQKYDMGNVSDANVIRDGGKIGTVLYIKDGRLITAVERGDREVSLGYVCKLDMTPGVVPEGEPDAGQRYDAIQSEIRVNHCAVVPRGRAGSDVRLHLDAAGHALLPVQEKKMKFERIDGVDYEVGSDPHRAAVERRDAAAKREADEKAKLEARAVAAEERTKKLDAELAVAKDPKRLDALASARAALHGNAKRILGEEFKLDGLDEKAIFAAIVAKVFPAVKLDGKPEAFVEGMYEAALTSSASSSAELGAVRADAAQAASASNVDPVEKARLDMMKRNQEAWKRPVNAHKAGV